jgi:hypothetical protein
MFPFARLGKVKEAASPKEHSRVFGDNDIDNRVGLWLRIEVALKSQLLKIMQIIFLKPFSPEALDLAINLKEASNSPSLAWLCN